MLPSTGGIFDALFQKTVEAMERERQMLALYGSVASLFQHASDSLPFVPADPRQMMQRLVHALEERGYLSRSQRGVAHASADRVRVLEEQNKALRDQLERTTKGLSTALGQCRALEQKYEFESRARTALEMAIRAHPSYATAYENLGDLYAKLASQSYDKAAQLDGASKAMRRFVRDAELARGSDLAELDASQLRIARQQLHQAVGALEMVGLGVPAKLLRGMEALAQKFVQRPELCSDDAANKVERASFAVAEYLEGELKGRKASPVALFPQYRDVQVLSGATRVHPADLWPVERRFREPDLAVTYLPSLVIPKKLLVANSSIHLCSLASRYSSTG